MAIYSIAYDLFQPQEYRAFYECLESFPHVHVMDSLWLVQTDDDAGALRDRMMPFINGGDSLFISRISQDWAGAGTQCGEWLNASDRHQALASRPAAV